MAPPVSGKAPAKKQRSTATKPAAGAPLRNVVPDSVDFRDRPYRPGRSGDWLRHLIFPLIGLSIIVYVLYEMDRAAKILGLAWVAIGVFYYLLLTIWIRKPAVLKI